MHLCLLLTTHAVGAIGEFLPGTGDTEAGLTPLHSTIFSHLATARTTDETRRGAPTGDTQPGSAAGIVTHFIEGGRASVLHTDFPHGQMDLEGPPFPQFAHNRTEERAHPFRA